MTSTSAFKRSTFVVASVVAIIAVLWAVPGPTIDRDGDIVPRAHAFMGRSLQDVDDRTHRVPFDGLTVAVTGATSGIGRGLTRRLVSLGAHVIAVGRSRSKLDSLVNDVADPSKLTTVMADFVDLQSVANAANEITEEFDQLDVLVNNAGILLPTNEVATSKQGYDLTFAVNYLAPFLFTEKLIPTMQKSPRAKIIQVSSTIHLQNDGEALRVPIDGRGPLASRPGGSHFFGMLRAFRSYANSKLAQIMHAHALNRRYGAERQEGRAQGNPIDAVSICPTFVATNIGQGGLAAFGGFTHDPNDFGLSSIFDALLDDGSTPITSDGVRTGKFYSNLGLFPLQVQLIDNMPGWMSAAVPIRDIFISLGGLVTVLPFQKLFPASGETHSTLPSYNKEIQEGLYKWSYNVIKPWL